MGSGCQLRLFKFKLDEIPQNASRPAVAYAPAMSHWQKRKPISLVIGELPITSMQKWFVRRGAPGSVSQYKAPLGSLRRGLVTSVRRTSDGRDRGSGRRDRDHRLLRHRSVDYKFERSRTAACRSSSRHRGLCVLADHAPEQSSASVGPYRLRSSANDYAHRCFDWGAPVLPIGSLPRAPL